MTGSFLNVVIINIILNLNAAVVSLLTAFSCFKLFSLATVLSYFVFIYLFSNQFTLGPELFQQMSIVVSKH